MNSYKTTSPMRIYVHLAQGQGAAQWERKSHDGTLLGINELKPYGYYLAEGESGIVVYSEDIQENFFQKLLRGALRVMLGFDLVHALRNSDCIWNSDVVWTHTESQALGVLSLFSLFPKKKRPYLIAQSVWLFDNWPRYCALRKWAYSKLLAQADILTVLSPENLRVCRQLFPQLRSELVLFGIKAERIARVPQAMHRPLRIVAVGNDRHRDWPTLIKAFGNEDDFELRIVSRTIPQKLLSGIKNIRVEKISQNSDLMKLYQWADISVVPLKPNLHASGITVIQEAVLQGINVVCSDTGGIKAYFNDKQVFYTPVGDFMAMRKAVSDLAQNRELREAMVRQAQSRMGLHGLSSQAFVHRHVELSEELLGRLPAELQERMAISS